jgi:uncharacterized RDD family membrane protein YckC
MEMLEDLLTDVEKEINLVPVSAGIRFADYLIDMVIFYILFVAVLLLLRSFISDSDGILLYIISYTLFVAYYTLIEGATNGRSVGKLITGSKAVKEDGTAITWNDALLRSLTRIVPFEPFSAFGSNPWHDRWTHTKVVKNDRR